MLVWGDVPAIHPDLLPELPDGVTVCEWGYEDNHPFAERTARLADAGRGLLGVPGHLELAVDLAGRVDNMLGNIAARRARRGRPRGGSDCSSPTGATWAITSSRRSATRDSRPRRRSGGAATRTPDLDADGARRPPRRALLRGHRWPRRGRPWWRWGRRAAWWRRARRTCPPWRCTCSSPSGAWGGRSPRG